MIDGGNTTSTGAFVFTLLWVLAGSLLFYTFLHVRRRRLDAYVRETRSKIVLTCALCGRTRRNEDPAEYMPYAWTGIGLDYSECPQCWLAKQAKKPHCGTCHCEGKERHVASEPQFVGALPERTEE